MGNPNEAQIRINPETGQAYIYVERPQVISLAHSSPKEIAEILEALKASVPSEEEVHNDRWNDELP